MKRCIRKKVQSPKDVENASKIDIRTKNNISLKCEKLTQDGGDGRRTGGRKTGETL